MPTLFTIGYATKPIDVFISQLQQHHIDVVADIRSVPYSKVFTDFHQENITRSLKQHNIRYVYLGEELGPRSKDPQHYNDEGQVQFSRLMQSTLFQQGIDRLAQGFAKNFTIALMCAEKDAATCHRSMLVGYYLDRHAITADKLRIFHIDHTGELESQDELENRLMTLHDNGMDLFMSHAERKQRAYEIQLEKTSYTKDP